MAELSNIINKTIITQDFINTPITQDIINNIMKTQNIIKNTIITDNVNTRTKLLITLIISAQPEFL